MKQAVLFVGHGTRLQSGMAECLAFTQLVEQHVVAELAMKQTEVEDTPYFDTCFLELQEPTIVQSIDRFVAMGIKNIHIVPLFLFAAGHLKTDLPLILEALLAKYPFLHLFYGLPLSQDERCSQACADRLRKSGWIPGDRNATVLFVGRGSKDEQAFQDFCTLVEQVCKCEGISPTQMHMGFLAGIGPRLEEALAKCLHHDCRSVYIVPVLLFQGRLLRGIDQKVRGCHQPNGDIQVQIAEHLGIHPYLVECVTGHVVRSFLSTLITTS